MEETRDLAIVLRSIPYEERHRIVTALTERHGLVSALARNAIQSRRFGGTLEPFAASEWYFIQKPSTELLRLEQAVIRRSYEGLRTDFELLALASLLNELALRLAPSIENSGDLFRIHSNALAWLEDAATTPTGGKPRQGILATTPGLALLNGYISKALQWSGNQPQLSACLGCQLPVDSLGAQASVTCIIASAAWICVNCRTQGSQHVQDRQGQNFHHASLRVSSAAIQDFHMSLGSPIRQIPALATATRREHLELFRFLEALLTYHVPGFDQSAFKSLRFLNLED
jgi:recombinational DNA repair protein (RecF pathway)